MLQIFTKAISYKNASKKNKYKNQDKHRWRHVAVWAAPFLTIPVISTVFVSSLRSLWLSIFLWVFFVLYCLLLLEWYIWKKEQKLQRTRLRILFALTCGIIFGLGFIWQHQLDTKTAMSVIDRPYVSVTEMGLFDLEIGKTPIAVAVFHNSGKTPAYKTEFYSCAQPRGRDVPERPSPCKELPGELPPVAPAFMPSNGVYRMVLPMEGTITARDLELIGNGTSVIYMWGTVTYQDGEKESHTLTYCARYKPNIKAFDLCPFDNEAN